MSQKRANPEPVETASGLGNVILRRANDFRKVIINNVVRQFRPFVFRYGLAALYGTLVAGLIHSERRP